MLHKSGFLVVFHWDVSLYRAHLNRKEYQALHHTVECSILKQSSDQGVTERLIPIMRLLPNNYSQQHNVTNTSLMFFHSDSCFCDHWTLII